MGTYAQRAALSQIVGKTITGIVVTEGTSFPRSQIFLTFSDNTYYELYSINDGIAGANHVRDGGIDEVKAATNDRSIAHEIVDTSTPRPAFSVRSADSGWPLDMYDEPPLLPPGTRPRPTLTTDSIQFLTHPGPQG